MESGDGNLNCCGVQVQCGYVGLKGSESPTYLGYRNLQMSRW